MMSFSPDKPLLVAFWLCLASNLMVGTRAACSGPGTPYYGDCWVEDTDLGKWLACANVDKSACETICDNSTIYPSKCSASDKKSSGGKDAENDTEKDAADGGKKEDWTGKDGDESKAGGKEDWTGKDGGESKAGEKEDCSGKDGDESKGGGKEDWTGKDGDESKSGEKEDWTGKDGDGSKEGGAPSFEHTWNGVATDRAYELHAPPSDVEPAGMVVVFYGCLPGLAARGGVLVVCPSPGPGGDWKALESDAEDADFVAELLAHLGDAHGVPANRRVVTGFSYGGSMAYRVLCERADSIGGIVPYGQAFFEPLTGHVEKGAERTNVTLTEQAIEQNVAARNDETKKCDIGSLSVPHRALVGTDDNYYGETGGAYKGKALWEDFSANVYGCKGTADSKLTGEAGEAITGSRGSTCYYYSGGCPGLSDGKLNQYCTVDGMGHDTIGWDFVMAKAVTDFFGMEDADDQSGSNNSMFHKNSLVAIAISTLLVVSDGIF